MTDIPEICELYLDHMPTWDGLTFICSNCGIEFVTKKEPEGSDLGPKVKRNSIIAETKKHPKVLSRLDRQSTEVDKGIIPQIDSPQFIDDPKNVKSNPVLLNNPEEDVKLTPTQMREDLWQTLKWVVIDIRSIDAQYNHNLKEETINKFLDERTDELLELYKSQLKAILDEMPDEIAPKTGDFRRYGMVNTEHKTVGGQKYLTDVEKAHNEALIKCKSILIKSMGGL